MEVESRLKQLVESINSNPKALSYIRDWLGDYPGKILSWRIGESRFYLSITPQGVQLHPGEYPAPEICWLSDEKTWLAILEGRLSPRESLSRGRLWIWGNYHEWEKFQKLLELVSPAK